VKPAIAAIATSLLTSSKACGELEAFLADFVEGSHKTLNRLGVERHGFGRPLPPRPESFG
jgi:hypothetical protein